MTGQTMSVQMVSWVFHLYRQTVDNGKLLDLKTVAKKAPLVESGPEESGGILLDLKWRNSVKTPI